MRRHQLEMLEAARAGRHALLTAPTGAGKTLAGFLPTLVDLIGVDSILRQAQDERRGDNDTLHTLYISPLKALAVDVQRNLLTPIEEMNIPIRVETRSGDTPANRKARQRIKPPHILLTTPESLNLLLSQEDSFILFANLKRIIIDEVHAFATGKRGDLLALSIARLQKIAPDLQRTALSATVADPDEYRAWLAPFGDMDTVAHVLGDEGAPADISIMIPDAPEGHKVRVPWAGHAGAYAVPQVMEQIKVGRMTLVFCNTRFLAEYIFQKLWDINEETLPIGIHHGSLSKEARRKIEKAMASGQMRALVCTASLDLGVDWGDIDCVIQMGAPKGSSRLLQRIGRANHRLDVSSKALLVPGNRFEFLEAQAALDAVEEGRRDGEPFRAGGLDVLAQHVMSCACAAPFHEDDLLKEVQSALPYSAITKAQFERILGFTRDGGYALKAYDKFKRLRRDTDGVWQLTHPKFAAQHRLNAGIIVDGAMLSVRFKNGRNLGKVEESFAAMLSPGDRFFFAGMSLELLKLDTADVFVRAAKKAAMIPSYMGARLPLTTHLSHRVRGLLTDRAGWARFPDDVREWLEMQDHRSVMPEPEQLLVETFPHKNLNYMVAYSFEGWNAHQSLGMLLTRRMETQGLGPIGFVANDYALACYSIEPVTNPAPLFTADILEHEFIDWVEGSYLLKRAFREVAVISGLVERQHPGKRKTGKQVSFSTDLIFDVLRKYEPDHLLMQAAWADARTRMTDVERLGDLLDRATSSMVHVDLDRVSPMAVPVLVMIGHENVARGATDDKLLIEAESLIDEAMRGN
ncbi:ATP-dependent, 3'-5' DNA helicase with strand annealing activity [hydrothermal vent metagenome]|uniref:ATP-dependent, 3'-5' DNA helicase with strand annealing activity n=1 Tax=hydrothermal vent metagenome TaxID=652676 RepID=A0A3B0RY77_9ZZZZ